ncbi:MAG TPA: transcriptional regulator [Mycobacteriales bacterium]|jgi:predicted ArsR family transcriptional regulator|nr:transcriptional regulator [Mycobacteriales bacterium]
MDLEQQVAGVAALDHDVSRAAYRLVLAEGWVSRDRAAEALGVARSVAAFHLDKLLDAGLLTTRYERTSGRSGPGAGRPAKLYGRSDAEFDVSLPPRRYDLASALLARGVERAREEREPVEQAVARAATDAGVEAGQACHGRSASTRVTGLLEGHGYAPRRRGKETALLNCPFHKLAQEHRDLVCGMNLCFLRGALEGTAADGWQARLAPEPGYCCVRLDAP